MNYTLRSSYNCMDTRCIGRLSTLLEYKDNKFNIDMCQITKNHSLLYEEHSYIIKKNIKIIIKKDIINDEIKKELLNYKFRLMFLKEILFQQKINIVNYTNLKNYYINKYNITEYNFNDLEKEEISTLCKKYKIKVDNNNKDEILNILNKYITLDNQIYTAISFYNKKNYNIKDINDQLINLEINNEKNIVTNLNVQFQRNNIIYNKTIYIIMTQQMGENLIDINNIQYFCDTTYNAVPYSNKKFKLWVLVAFNTKVQHTILCSLALIKNENKETFLTIYDFLEQKYKFLPNIITVDFGRGGYTALKEKYPKINIILCYYHYINRIKNHIKNNYKGPEDKYNKLYNDLLSNFKLIPFINTEDLNIFIDKLKTKFNK